MNDRTTLEAVIGRYERKIQAAREEIGKRQEPSLEEMITSGHRAVGEALVEDQEFVPTAPELQKGADYQTTYTRLDKSWHPYMELVVNHSFEAAHRLPGHTGKCERLHGHSYRVRVRLKGPVREDGMIIDFGHVKDLIDQLDHRYLNDFMYRPTAENTAKWLLERIPLAVEVRVWEGLGGGSVVARV